MLEHTAVYRATPILIERIVVYNTATYIAYAAVTSCLQRYVDVYVEEDLGAGVDYFVVV